MKKIRKNALWIAMVILGIVVILLWAIEKISSGDIKFFTGLIVISIALVIIGQVNLIQTKKKLNTVPIEIVEPFRQLHQKEQDDVVWFTKKLLFLYQKIEDELLIFNTINALLEKAVKNNEIFIHNLKAEKEKASLELNATNEKFEALRKKIL